MNLPNRLTVLRILLIPVFLFFFFVEAVPLHYLWALVVFSAASLTDMLDGNIARKNNLITDFGKLMDPLADKLLVMSALICLLQGSVFALISLILIMSREFLVTSMRLLAAGKGIVLAADVWGKLKTISQMIYICLALLHLILDTSNGLEGVSRAVSVPLAALETVFFFLMLGLTVLSGFHYCMKNRQLFADA